MWISSHLWDLAPVLQIEARTEGSTGAGQDRDSAFVVRCNHIQLCVEF